MVSTLIAMGLVLQVQTPAQELLHQVQAKIAAADTMSLTEVMQENMDGAQSTVQVHVKAKKPRMLRVEYEMSGKSEGMMQSDGNTLYSVHAGRYSKQPLDSHMSLTSFTGIGLGSFFNQSFGNHELSFDGEYKLVSKEPKQAVFKGKPVSVLNLDQPVGNLKIHYNLYIDRAALLPVGYQETIDMSGHHMVVTVQYDQLQLNEPLEASLFAFKADPGVTESKGIEGDLLAVGATAPTFKAATAHGNAVSLVSSLKGHKALLLNFWFYG